jgi:RHS repeat-associated protein
VLRISFAVEVVMEFSMLKFFTDKAKAGTKRRHLEVANKAILAFVIMTVLVMPACQCNGPVPPHETEEPAPPIDKVCESLSPPTFVPNAQGHAAGMTLGEGTVTANGQSNYVIPIESLVGRGKVQPDLALRYESDTPNGILGVGWTLGGLSTIIRCRRTAAEDEIAEAVSFSDADRFCLDGRRLVLFEDEPSSAYGTLNSTYRTQRDIHAKIVITAIDSLGPTEFKLYAKDGWIYTYGGSTASVQGQRVQFSHGGLGEIVEDYSEQVRFAWNISRVEDRLGNFMTFTYNIDEDDHSYEHLISSIAYTGSDPLDLAPRRTVEFSYEPREDDSVFYVSGFKLKRTKRLSRISLRRDGDDVRTYYMDYQPSTATGRTLLLGVQECAADGTCKAPTTFAYSIPEADEQNPMNERFERIHLLWSQLVPGFGNSVNGTAELDINDDGRNDWFEYGSSRSTGKNLWTLNLNYQTRTDPNAVVAFGLTTGGYDQNTRYMDVDGDGVLDELKLEIGPTAWRRTLTTSRTQGAAGELIEEGIVTIGGGYYPGPPGIVYLADFTGNGLLDWVRFYDDGTSDWRPNVSGVPGPYSGQEWPPGPYNFGLNVDVNGSGRSGLLACYRPNTANCTNFASISLASGEPETSQTTIVGGDHAFTLFSDVNGDNLEDAVIVRDEGGFLDVQINTGNGFLAPEPWPLALDNPLQRSPYGEPMVFSTYPSSDLYNEAAPWRLWLRPANTNDDDFADFILIRPTGGDHRITLLESTGDSSNGSHTTSFAPHETAPYLEDWRYARVMDANGDGLTDVAVPFNDGMVLYQQNGPKADLLVSVNILEFEYERFQYASATEGNTYTPAPRTDCDYPARCEEDGFWVVAAHNVYAGHRPRRTVFEYTDKRVDILRRKSLGFAQIKATNLLVNSETTTTYDHQTRVGEYFPFAMVPRTIQTLAPTGVHSSGPPVYRKYMRVIDSALVINPTETIYWVYPERSELTVEEGPLSSLETISIQIQEQQLNEYGFPTFTTREDYPIENGVPGPSPHILSETTTYWDNVGDWLLGLEDLVTTTSTTPDGSQQTRITDLDHDPTTGLLASQQRGTDPSDVDVFREQSYLYSPAGLVETITDSRSGETRTMNLVYDDEEHIFAEVITNPLLHTSAIEYDHALGVPTAITDANGVRIEFEYDGFGRVTEVDRPDDRDVSIKREMDSQARVLVMGQIGGSAEVTVLFNQSGQTLARLQPDLAGRRVAYTAAVYDDLSRVVAASVPAWTNETPDCYTFEYDNFNRTTKIQHPDGESRGFTYDGLTTTIQNERGFIRQIERDALERPIVNTRFRDDGNPVVTTFSYGPFDTLVNVLLPDDSERNIEYDDYGRPYSIDDPNSGHSDMGFNAFDELHWVKDALDVTTNYEYDLLGRLTSIDNSDGETATFEWDTKPMGVGARARIVSMDGIITDYGYDSLGRHARTTLKVDGHDYTVNKQYDNYGRIKAIVYPEIGFKKRLTAEFAYSSSGFLNTIRVKDPGVRVEEDIWSVTDRDAAGRVLGEQLGNGVERFMTFSPRGWVETITEQNQQGTILQSMAFDYDAGGNLVSIVSDVEPKTYDANFGYDAFDRLKWWETMREGELRSIDYYYSDIGNIMGIVERDTQGTTIAETAYRYGEAGVGPHAVTSVEYDGGEVTHEYTYDAKGNQITGPMREIVYNTFNLPRSISADTGNDGLRFGHASDTTNVSFRYDAEHRRVVKDSGSSTKVVYVDDLFEARIEPGGTTYIHYIGLVDNHIAEIQVRDTERLTRREVIYYQKDSLGSVIGLTDENGNVTQRFTYTPFGERSEGAQSVTRGYTGHQHDLDVGVVDMKGRIYDPHLTRFLSVDPVTGDPLNEQAYNGYAYVYNNPLRYVDPTGLEADSDCVYGPIYVEGNAPGNDQSGSTGAPTDATEGEAGEGEVAPNSDGPLGGGDPWGSDTPNADPAPDSADDNGAREMPGENPVGYSSGGGPGNGSPNPPAQETEISERISITPYESGDLYAFSDPEDLIPASLKPKEKKSLHVSIAGIGRIIGWGYGEDYSFDLDNDGWQVDVDVVRGSIGGGFFIGKKNDEPAGYIGGKLNIFTAIGIEVQLLGPGGVKGKMAGSVFKGKVGRLGSVGKGLGYEVDLSSGDLSIVYDNYLGLEKTTWSWKVANIFEALAR